jgi:hypothetical protein
MSKKYYYTCPIKALYMMKEFEVLFYLDDGESSTHPFIRNDEDEFEIADHELLKRCEGYNKIYIEEESEHIFEPRNYDLAGFTRDDGISTVAQYDGAKKAFINGSFRILKKYNPKIIIRDNKQFFYPEVEND